MFWLPKIANKKDPYWVNVGYILAQFDGITAGAQMANSAITNWDLILLNGVGDLIDLTRALFPEDRPDIDHRVKKNFYKTLLLVM